MAIKITPAKPDWPSIRRQRSTRWSFWSVLGWGSAAAVALAAVAMTSQTGAGSQRLQLALAYMVEPPHAIALIPPRPTEAEAETQRVAAQVRALATEREQLRARIANLERNLDEVTGSITRQASLAVLLRPANPPPAPLAPSSMPAVTAAVPASASEPASALPLPRKAEFGIDLGGASSVETLRIHWATMRSNYGALLGGLHAVIAQRPRRPAGTEYRLLAGPLPTIAASAHLCARLPVTRAGCRPARFSGSYLAEP
jgi:hypothetical protein